MIIYPSNIDSGLTKKQGRKISKKSGVNTPKVSEMFKALDILGEDGVIIEKDAAYPRSSYENEGRIIIDRKESKILFMRRLAKEIKRLRTPS